MADITLNRIRKGSSTPPIVFVHGFLCSHRDWQQQVSHFLSDHTVVSCDLRGHGDSLRGKEPMTIETVGGDVARLLGEENLMGAILVGHSMGALAALETASRYPDKVSGLALLGVAAKMPVHPNLLDAAVTNDHKAIDLIADWGHGARAHGGGNIASGIWLLQNCKRLLERAHPGVLANDLAAADAYKTALNAASAVQCYTLCLLAAQDKMTPLKAAQPLVLALSDVNEVVLPDSGHMMMLETPGETLDALIEFLGKRES